MCLKIRRKNAGILAFFATLTRLQGLALSVFFIIEYYLQVTQQTHLSRHSPLPTRDQCVLLLKKMWIYLLPLIAFASYLLYIHINFGDWQKLFHSMHQWGQDQMTLPIQTVVRYIKILLLTPVKTLSYYIAILELMSVLWYLFILIYSWRRIRSSYWFFMLGAFLIPSLTGTFQGMPRYGIHLYPFFLSWMLFFTELPRPVRYVLAILLIVLQVVLISLFTRGYFVA